MMPKELIALIASNDRVTCPEGLTIVSHNGFHAIFSSEKPLGRLQPRSGLAARIVRRQEYLEALLSEGTVLPALSGVSMRISEVPDFLEINADLLHQTVERLARNVQFQISILEDTAGSVRLSLPEGSSARIATLAAERLSAVAEELTELPRDSATLFNAVILIDPLREGDLDRVLEEIDALWPHALRIRQIGPAPAASFGSIGARRVSSREIAAARSLLGVGETASAGELACARRRALISSAPEFHEDIKAAASILGLPVPKSDDNALVAFVWREGRAEPSRVSRSVA